MSDALFTFELEDQSSGSADNAADALERMRAKIIEDTAALAQMNKALRSIKGSTHASSDAFKQLKERVATQKASIAAAHLGYVKAGGTFAKVKKPTDELSQGMRSLNAFTEGLPRPLGAMVSKLGAAQSSMSSGVVAAGALAAGYIALAAAVLVSVAAIAKHTLASSDARRNEKLQLEGLTKTRNWYGLAADSAGFLQSQVDKVSDSVSLGRDKITAMASSLYKANLRGGNLQLALEGVAIATAAAGEEQGQLYRNMILGGARAQGGIKAIVGDIKARFGGVAKAQMLSLGVQSQKLRENMSRIFAVPIEGFLAGLHSVTSLLSQQEATGRALHSIMKAVFGDTGSGAEDAGFAVKRFFQGMTINALKVSIAFFKLRNKLRSVFDGNPLSGFLTAKDMLLAGKAAAVGLAIVLLPVVAGFAAIGAVIAINIKRASLFASGAIAAYEGLKSGGKRAVKFIKGLNWGQLGKDIVLGIVVGLNPMPIVKKMLALGGAAIAAFKKATDSHSPSRRMAKEAFELPAGGAIGIKRGAPKLVSSVKKMGDDAIDAFKGPAKDRVNFEAPKLVYSSKRDGARSDDSGPRTPPPTTPGAGAGAYSGPLIRINNLTITAKDDATANDIGVEVRAQLEELVQQAIAQMGAA